MFSMAPFFFVFHEYWGNSIIDYFGFGDLAGFGYGLIGIFDHQFFPKNINMMFGSSGNPYSIWI